MNTHAVDNIKCDFWKGTVLMCASRVINNTNFTYKKCLGISLPEFDIAKHALSKNGELYRYSLLSPCLKSSPELMQFYLFSRLALLLSQINSSSLWQRDRELLFVLVKTKMAELIKCHVQKTSFPEKITTWTWLMFH